MADLDRVVRKAIEESVAEFVRGVRSHNPDDPDVAIPDEVVEWLKTDNAVKESFGNQLGSGQTAKKEWAAVGPRVCRAAFHAGSLAAFSAYSEKFASEKGAEVTVDHVKNALDHVRDPCKARFGDRFAYCPRWSFPDSTKSERETA